MNKEFVSELHACVSQVRNVIQCGNNMILSGWQTRVCGLGSGKSAFLFSVQKNKMEEEEGNKCT